MDHSRQATRPHVLDSQPPASSKNGTLTSPDGAARVGQESRVPNGLDNFWNRVKSGFYAPSSFQNRDIQFEMRGLQPFRKNDTAYALSLGSYIMTVSMHSFSCCMLLDAITSLGDSEAQAVLFAEHKIPLLIRLRTVTL